MRYTCPYAGDGEDGRDAMKAHKFWGLAACFCMLAAVYTGYKRA